MNPMRLEVCLLAAALVHALIFVPGWAGWFSPVSQSGPLKRLPRLLIHLQPAAKRLLSRSPNPSLSSALPGQPQARPAANPKPVEPPQTPARPSLSTRVEPALPSNPSPPQAQKGYPIHHPTQVRHSAATPSPSDGSGETPMDPPVMLKGPQLISIPTFLRNRDGHFLLTLRCRIEKDGSSQVQVMEGTGAPGLDEAVRESFSGLPWYRAEVAGQPVAVTVRLVIEGSWEAGQDSINWGGRIPPME